MDLCFNSCLKKTNTCWWKSIKMQGIQEPISWLTCWNSKGFVQRWLQPCPICVVQHVKLPRVPGLVDHQPYIHHVISMIAYQWMGLLGPARQGSYSISITSLTTAPIFMWLSTHPIVPPKTPLWVFNKHGCHGQVAQTNWSLTLHQNSMQRLLLCSPNRTTSNAQPSARKHTGRMAELRGTVQC